MLSFTTKLANCAEIIIGKNIDKSRLQKCGTPYITGASNIVDGHLKTDFYVEETTLHNPGITRKGDIIVSTVGTLGKLGINNLGRCVLSGHVAAIRLKKGVSVHYALAMISRLILEAIPQNESPTIGFQNKMSIEAIKDIEFALPDLLLQEYAVMQMTSIASIILAFNTHKEDLLDFRKLMEIINEQRKTYRKNVIEKSKSLGKLAELLPAEHCPELIEEIKMYQNLLLNIK